MKYFLTRVEGSLTIFYQAQRHQKAAETFLGWFQEERLRISGFPLSHCDHSHIANGRSHSYISGSSPVFSWTNSFQSLSVQVWLITSQGHCLPALPRPNVEGTSFPLDSCHFSHTFDVICFPIVFVHQIVQNWRHNAEQNL